MGNGSKIDKLYANGGGSKLDQLYSDGGGDAATKAATRERKTNDMIDRSLQRAMRSGTPAERIAAARTYQERSSQPGYQQGGGIGSSEANQQRDQKTGEKFTAEGLRLEGKENPVDVVAGQADAANKPASPSVGDGSGRDALNARGSLAEGSTGGEWTNVGPSATTPATTLPAATSGVGSGTPAVPDWRQQRAVALEALKGRFDEENPKVRLAETIKNSDLIKAGDPKEIASVREKGRAIGIEDKDMTRFLNSAFEKESSPLTEVAEQKTPPVSNDDPKEVSLDPNRPFTVGGEVVNTEGFGKKPSDSAILQRQAMSSRKPTIREEGGESPSQPTNSKTPEKRGSVASAFSEDVSSALDAGSGVFDAYKSGVRSYTETLSGAASNVYSLGTKIAENIAPGKTGDRIREWGLGDKTKDSVYNATQVVPKMILGDKKKTPTAPIPDQASNDMKLQRREAAYQAPIDDVLERSNFLQRYA